MWTCFGLGSMILRDKHGWQGYQRRHRDFFDEVTVPDPIAEVIDRYQAENSQIFCICILGSATSNDRHRPCLAKSI